MPRTIQPDRILHELSELWVSLGKQHGDESAGVLRACAMTLVVVAEAREDAAEVGETLALLMREHPSRAMVVRVRDEDAPELEARVFAQCWMPFGQRRQICCEQIEIIGVELLARRRAGRGPASGGGRSAGGPMVSPVAVAGQPRAEGPGANRNQDHY